METNGDTHLGSCRFGPVFSNDAFSRLDDGNDKEFYALDRFVSHLDSLALETVGRLIGTLVVEEYPVILDLMAGWDSHIPKDISPNQVVGLGLNENELKANKDLTGYVVHDLNQEPTLPFPDETFDLVLDTVSVDYLIHPFEVFREVGRVLKPGGLHLVIFSNRFFPGKAVKVWREAAEEERVLLIEDYFKESGLFEDPVSFVSRGKPRPKDDPYAHLTHLSDPVYAVWAERLGAEPDRAPRPTPEVAYGKPLSEEQRAARIREIKETRCCPYCGERMKKWEVPDSPFGQTWDNEFMYICFNDCCPYYVRGWDVMARQKNRTSSYRLMYHPEKDCCLPVPVPSPRALREGIMPED